MSSGDLVYFMLPVGDGDRAQKFFGGLFGWAFSPGSVPGGFNIDGSTPHGGMFAAGEPDEPKVWFEVDDIEAARAKVAELGGEAEEAERIESGHVAACTDDQGTRFNIWAAG